MKFIVFYLQSINSLEGPVMFFSSAAIIRRLRKYTATMIHYYSWQNLLAKFPSNKGLSLDSYCVYLIHNYNEFSRISFHNFEIPCKFLLVWENITEILETKDSRE